MLASMTAGQRTQIITFVDYIVSDGKGGLDQATVTLTITGQNDSASISGTAMGAVQDDGVFVHRLRSTACG